MAKTLIALFPNERDAQAALRDLDAAGFGAPNVSYVDRESNLLVDNLHAAGIAQDDALIYADGVKRGGVLIVVQGLSEAAVENAEAVLRHYALVDVDAGRAGTQQGVAGTSATAGSARPATRQPAVYDGTRGAIPIVGEESTMPDSAAPEHDPDVNRDVSPHRPHDNY